MAIKTIPFREVEEKVENMYEAVAVMFGQARLELADRILDKAIQDVESEEYGMFEEVEEPTPETYEEKEKVTTSAIGKFLEGDVTWRKPDNIE